MTRDSDFDIKWTSGDRRSVSGLGPKIQYAPQIDQLTILSMNSTFSWSADRKWKNQLISQKYNMHLKLSANHSEYEFHILMVS